ncbi:MAG TPA: methyltransferase domain-containing protein [Acidimicrobiales bacterium]|nr:methyltransferase domain-containing protein [Acidimicrobiales bacterium]
MSPAPAGDWDGATYDRVAAPQARWGGAVLDRLQLVGGERVLDAGCGSGRVTEQLLDRFPGISVVALDAAPSMLTEARARLARFGGRVEFVEADLAEPLPVGDRALAVPVDAVVSTAAFHWVLDHDRLFAHLAAVLRPGGSMVAQCGGEGNIATVVAALRQLGHDEPSPWLFASPADTSRRLEAAGFTDVDAWLHEEPTPFDDDEALHTFLATVVLRSHLDRLPAADQQPLVEAVAELVPGRVLDYVRLTMVATRADSGD